MKANAHLRAWTGTSRSCAIKTKRCCKNGRSWVEKSSSQSTLSLQQYSFPNFWKRKTSQQSLCTLRQLSRWLTTSKCTRNHLPSTFLACSISTTKEKKTKSPGMVSAYRFLNCTLDQWSKKWHFSWNRLRLKVPRMTTASRKKKWSTCAGRL